MKVFVASTEEDIRDARAEVIAAIEEECHEAVHFESPDFPASGDGHGHDVCVDRVFGCDLLLLIVDRRAGVPYAGDKYPRFKRYEVVDSQGQRYDWGHLSATWAEVALAFEEDIPVYTFVRQEVWDERPVYKKNRGPDYRPVHCDDVRVFRLIDFVSSRSRHNWVETWDNSVDLRGRIKAKLDMPVVPEKAHGPHPRATASLAPRSSARREHAQSPDSLPEGGSESLSLFFSKGELAKLRHVIGTDCCITAFASDSIPRAGTAYHLGHFFFARCLDRIQAEHGLVGLLICDTGAPSVTDPASHAYRQDVERCASMWRSCFQHRVPVGTIGSAVRAVPLHQADWEVAKWLDEAGRKLLQPAGQVVAELERWRYQKRLPGGKTLASLADSFGVQLGEIDADSLCGLAVTCFKQQRDNSRPEGWLCRLIKSLVCHNGALVLGGTSIAILEADKNRYIWDAMAACCRHFDLGEFPQRVYLRSLPALDGSGPMRTGRPEGVIPLASDWRENIGGAPDDLKNVLRISAMFGRPLGDPVGEVGRLVIEGVERLGLP